MIIFLIYALFIYFNLKDGYHYYYLIDIRLVLSVSVELLGRSFVLRDVSAILLVIIGDGCRPLRDVLRIIGDHFSHS